MTAPGLNYPGNRGIGNGQSPTTPAGAVRINGRVDTAYCDEAKMRIRIGSAGVQGGISSDNFLVHHSEIVVSEKRQRPRNGDQYDTKTDTDIYIVPCANGWGEKGETQQELTERINQVYVSTGRRMDKGQSEGLALLRGGLSTLPLYGPVSLKSGQRACVVAPDPANPKPFPTRTDLPETKIPFWLVPFDEVNAMGSLATAYDILTRSWTTEKIIEYGRQFPNSLEWAYVLGKSIGATTLSVVSALLDAGVITLHEPEEWKSTQRAVGDLRANALMRLAAHVMEDIQTTSSNGTPADHSDDGNVVVPSTGERLSLKTFLYHRVFARDPKYRIANPDERSTTGNQRIYSNAPFGRVVEQCNSNLAELCGGLRHCDMNAQRTIIGTVLTNADPGQDVDIHLGSNLM